MTYKIGHDASLPEGANHADTLRFLASSRFLSIPFFISTSQSVPSQTIKYSPIPTINKPTT